MAGGAKPNHSGKAKGAGLMSLLRPYRAVVFVLILFALLSNGMNLVLPRIIARAIDSYPSHYHVKIILVEFFGAALFVFVFTYLQSVLQTNTAERVARDLRARLSDRISVQSFALIEKSNPSRLLTNLTADVDSVKLFISQAFVTIVSSLIMIIGTCIMLISLNWRLALPVISIIPIISGVFYFVLKRIRPLFIKGREVIDRLNKVINESILGSALIRVVNAQVPEYEKFLGANNEAKSLGMRVLKQFAWLIPVIILVASLANIAILTLGGHYVIIDHMSLGDFAAFNSYLALLIFPILLIGFMNYLIAQASASHKRLLTILELPGEEENGELKANLLGEVEMEHVFLSYAEKQVLKDINFRVESGSSLAIVGPTAAGKTQILNLLSGLTKPTKGSIRFDNRPLSAYDRETFYQHIGLVFQDSILFNTSIRENIAFSTTVTDESLNKAIVTAELRDFIEALPERLDTLVSERGTSLSGGQKQRIMLARALTLNPKILLLDDFTARVDSHTEKKILDNVKRHYPGLTLISVTQKIASAETFDQVMVLMEGEVVAAGTHASLLATSPEYVQIYQSQQTTHELQPE